MARGDKSAYTDKQKRQAEHIEEGYEQQGRSRDDAERIAWATVNKESGGGRLSGSGREHRSNGSNGNGHSVNGSSSAHHERNSGSSTSGHMGGSARSREERSEAAKRGWATRRSKDALK